MARKPNYDFERRARDQAKAAKSAERLKAKSKAETAIEPEQAALQTVEDQGEASTK